MGIANSTFAVFATQALALAASALILASASSQYQDIVAATGFAVVPQITNSWATPYQRITDNLWVIPLHPTIVVTGQGGWTTAVFNVSWL